ncbi:hypothetical protein AYO47_07625 [Planctomyces sp. SCGC AG-212-M04]|nr:hypothetical protein AYO47_07625 [Planctomyces sp. SCGC AG-212-M04]
MRSPPDELYRGTGDRGYREWPVDLRRAGQWLGKQMELPMSDSRFWRLIAVLMVVGVFYVGHGLHSGSDPVLTLDSPAFAGAPWGNPDRAEFYTVSEDGKIVYIWNTTGRRLRSEGWVEATPKPMN